MKKLNLLMTSVLELYLCKYFYFCKCIHLYYCTFLLFPLLTQNYKTNFSMIFIIFKTCTQMKFCCFGTLLLHFKIRVMVRRLSSLTDFQLISKDKLCKLLEEIKCFKTNKTYSDYLEA